MKFKKMLTVYDDVISTRASFLNVKICYFECAFMTMHSGWIEERLYKIYWNIPDVIMKNYLLSYD